MTSAFFVNSHMRRTALFALAALLFSLQSTAGAQVIEISTNEQLESLIAEGVPVVDLRTPEEWRATGIISGSKLLTFFDSQGNYDVGAWLGSFTAIARPEDEVAVICAVGNRSHVVTRFLQQQLGYARLYNVSKGIDHWIRSGRPVDPWP